MKSVKISKTHVTTRYKKDDFDVFKNELFFYLLGQQKRLSFIPKLVSYDCSKLIICVENVGITLEEYCNSDEELNTFLPNIKKIYDKFVKLGYYHNDLRYKNIIINPDTKNLYLIDFEFTDREYKDLDDENIVKKITKNKRHIKRQTKKR
jgi:tRNA A-37 threonylcarbamoyl transferase component Bud32